MNQQLSFYPTSGLQELQRAWEQANETERFQFLDVVRRHYLYRRRQEKRGARGRQEDNRRTGAAS